jgi:phosphoadenosine phosphosulfate reductase
VAEELSVDDHNIEIAPLHVEENTDDAADPREILEWVAANVGRLAVATSFQSSGMVILHLMKTIRPEVPVVFLNTGFHFEETLAFRDRIVEQWQLNLVELRGEHQTPQRQAQLYGAGLYRMNPDLCCSINKVRPLQRALETYDGWISGVRRDQSAERAGVPLIGKQVLPSGKWVLNIHPLANWTADDVAAYIAHHDIPTHPLLEIGYSSIGCWPCTRPVAAGEDGRAGRWPGADKTECGIHRSVEDGLQHTGEA